MWRGGMSLPEGVDAEVDDEVSFVYKTCIHNAVWAFESGLFVIRERERLRYYVPCRRMIAAVLT
jgi:hypothetical protein